MAGLPGGRGNCDVARLMLLALAPISDTVLGGHAVWVVEFGQ